MKKEVSEHLARTFLDNRSKKKSSRKPNFILLLSLCLVISFVSALILLEKGGRGGISVLGHNIVLEKHDGPYILNFDLDDAPSKMQSLIIDLAPGGIDVSRYDTLKFNIRVKDADVRQTGSIKVGLVNNRRETSSLYISDVKNSWKKVVVPFSDLRQIHDWSCLTQLFFSLEEWNLFPKKGQILIDSIEFSKK